MVGGLRGGLRGHAPRAQEATPLDENRVVTAQHIVGRFRLTGIELDGAFGAIITIKNGKILSAIGYASPRRAKRAAGLLD